MMQTAIEKLGFVKSTIIKDLFNLNTEHYQICVLVQEERIQSISFNVNKHDQPDYEYRGTGFCKLYVEEFNKKQIINAVVEVSKGNNSPWVALMNPMTNPVLKRK